MSKFKVDNEQVNESVEVLKKLLVECEDAYNKRIPTSDKGKGQTHTELDILCDNFRTTCYCLGELINSTIQFLGESSNMFAQSEKNSASVLNGGYGSFGGGDIGSR